MALIGVTIGFGSTVITKVKVAPVQSPTLGVTKYTAVLGALFVLNKLPPNILPEAILLESPPVTDGWP